MSLYAINPQRVIEIPAIQYHGVISMDPEPVASSVGQVTGLPIFNPSAKEPLKRVYPTVHQPGYRQPNFSSFGKLFATTHPLTVESQIRPLVPYQVWRPSSYLPVQSPNSMGPNQLPYADPQGFTSFSRPSSSLVIANNPFRSLSENEFASNFIDPSQTASFLNNQCMKVLGNLDSDSFTRQVYNLSDPGREDRERMRREKRLKEKEQERLEDENFKRDVKASVVATPRQTPIVSSPVVIGSRPHVSLASSPLLPRKTLSVSGSSFDPLVLSGHPVVDEDVQQNVASSSLALVPQSPDPSKPTQSPQTFEQSQSLILPLLSPSAPEQTSKSLSVPMKPKTRRIIHGYTKPPKIDYPPIEEVFRDIFAQQERDRLEETRDKGGSVLAWFFKGSLVDRPGLKERVSSRASTADVSDRPMIKEQEKKAGFVLCG